VEDLPALNALLNSASALLLLTGYYFIRRRQPRIHRIFMIAAFVSSCLFLTSYIVYHANVGTVHFTGRGFIRPVYLSILTTHTILAAAVPVLAVITLIRALRGKFSAHRAVARWTLPVWLYVSVTGVIIYVLLYRLSWPA
jgi:uncharacterized membrane protein YozB (DUF420 family)